MFLRRCSRNSYANRLSAARERAAAVAKSESYRKFVDEVRRKVPWRFNGVKELERYLRSVDHHILNFIPKVLYSVEDNIRAVFDFGCGSGGSSIALAMIFPEIHCYGVDISSAEVSIANERARLYGVDDRCKFDCIDEGQKLPVLSNKYDLCICCSVLEYVTDKNMRKFSMQEMARVITIGGLLFISVPNRLYPIENHSRKFGWNYFPNFLKARIVGSHVWEVQSLVRPQILKLYRTPLLQLVTPWTNFCLKKESSPSLDRQQ